MPSHHQQTITQAMDLESLQAWKAFSLAFWDEPDYGLSPVQQRELFQAGFQRSRWALYDLHEHGVDSYLSDFLALRLQAANAKYQTVLADRVLCGHVMSNYFHVPTTYCVISAGGIQWLATPWWETGEETQPVGLCIHPLQPGAKLSVQDVTLPAQLDPIREHQRLETLREQAKRDDHSLVVTSAVPVHPVLAQMADESLLHVLLVRQPDDWLPELVSATLVLGHRSASRQSGVLRVELGALSAAIDPETGLITRCRALNDAGDVESVSHHPDNGAALLGQQMPDWAQARDALLRFFDEASYLRVCHLTFVITEQGLSFVAAQNDQLAAHQMHQPLLDNDSIDTHLKRLQM
jgi:hypothetical protein